MLLILIKNHTIENMQKLVISILLQVIGNDQIKTLMNITKSKTIHLILNKVYNEKYLHIIFPIMWFMIDLSLIIGSEGVEREGRRRSKPMITQ